jgi:pimeloyl-ACP methyl ester carboxylesterase
MSAELRSLDRDGVRLVYTDSGSGDPPLFFVHGWCCDHTYWREQTPLFARDHRVVAVDLRGHGSSGKPEQPYTMAAFVDDLVWLAGQIGLERPVVVGHSMGGAIATLLGASHPERTRGLVLVDPAILIPESHHAPMRDAMRGPDPKGFAATLIASFIAESTPPELAREITPAMLATPEHVMASAGEAIWSFDQWAAFRSLAMPVLIVSAPAMGEFHRAAANVNPRARVEIIPGCGHFVQLERPDLLNEYLTSFVATVA